MFGEGAVLAETNLGRGGEDEGEGGVVLDEVP